MTFLSHTAKSHRFATASSPTLSGRGSFGRRAGKRVVVAQLLQLAALEAGQPGKSTRSSKLAGEPWRGSGP